MTKYSLLFIFSLLFLIPAMLYGQGPHDLIVNPSDGGGYLNNVVAGDTTATGERQDLERVYVLKRDSLYFVNFQIEIDGFDLRMRAEDGAGRRPVIYITVNIVTGSSPNEIFRPIRTGGNLWVKDLILVGFIEEIAGEIANIPSGLIRVDAAGYDIEIDGCLLTQTRGQHIRTPGATRVVKVTNSIFANMGDLGRSNLGAGKAIDIRDTSCDTMLFVNNTFVNFQDRIIRHRASAGAINHLIFDHNTIVNGGSYHGTLALGWMGEEARVTNNLFIDPFVFGNDTDAVRQSEFEEHGELDEFGFNAMRWIFSVPNDSTSWTVSNNYYSISSEVQALYDRYAAAGLTGEGQPLSDHINDRLGGNAADAFTKESIALANKPDPMTNMVDWYRDCVSGPCKTKATGELFIRELHDFDRREWQYFDETLDATYPTSTAAYTGADDGGPVGDLNWWDLVGIDDIPDITIISDFQLKQNYPNPFNPSTNIEFTLAKSGIAKLEIYSVTGQKVATLVDGRMPAGNHSVTWKANNIASGIYFYQLHFGKVNKTRKMVLLR